MSVAQLIDTADGKSWCSPTVHNITVGGFISAGGNISQTTGVASLNNVNISGSTNCQGNILKGNARNVINLTGDVTLSATDTGAIYTLASSTLVRDKLGELMESDPAPMATATITLPALQSGLQYTFIFNTATLGGTCTFTFPSTSAYGNVISSTCVNFTAKTNLAVSASVWGDRIDVFCNGTNYFVTVFTTTSGNYTTS